MNATALRLLAVLALAAASLAGCGELPSLRELAGLPKDSDPSSISNHENKWLLIKNPASVTFRVSRSTSGWKTQGSDNHGHVIFGKDSLIAPPGS